MPMLTTEDVLAGLPRLPAFPRIVTQVLAALDDENSSQNTLTTYLQHDPVIAGRVLAAANASQFSHRLHGGIGAAVSLIGMRRVREIVLTTSLMDFSRQARSVPFFWEHSLAVGICAQDLAREFNLDQDHALVSGLLHDIGKLWMSHLHPQENQQVLALMAVEPRPLCEIERQVFGLDHCDIGQIIGQYWNLPEDVIESIARHHEPDCPQLGLLAAIVHVAEAISNGLDMPPRNDNQVIDISERAIAVLGLDWSGDTMDLLGRMDARFQHARAFLQ